MKLTEYKTKIKTKLYHYFVDENDNTQGEYKEYYNDSQLFIHCYFKDNELHGECKVYNRDGSLKYTRYFSNGNDITDL